MNKDGTAQGVAKVRHWESLHLPQQRLYHDPYAYAMYPGSIVQKWMGPLIIDKLYRYLGMGGFSEMISIRTRWLDDQIQLAVFNEEQTTPAKQLVILGAGYDTRGFRLDLWREKNKNNTNNGNDSNENNNDSELKVIEVDQRQVQQRKLSNLLWLSNRGDEDGQRIADRMGTTRVQFLPVDFTTDDLKQKLVLHEGFQSMACSVITMEGVTQYIPKESTADTLKKLKDIVAPGSTLLLTYVDQNYLGDGETVPKSYQRIQQLAAKVGEPWVSGWTKEDFRVFLRENGYEVVSDTAMSDYNLTYLKDVNRQLPEEELMNLERFVVARTLPIPKAPSLSKESDRKFKGIEKSAE